METSSPPAADPQALAASIKALVAKRRLREAMALCAPAWAAAPDDAWLATMQAYLHLELGENDAAAEIAAEAIRLGATDPTAELVLGVANRRRGRPQEAAAALLMAHRKLPNHVDTARMLIEETAAAHGLDAARPLHESIAARMTDRRLASAWAKLLFDAGRDAELPPGFLSAPLSTVAAWLKAAGTPAQVVGPQERIPVEEPPIVGGPPATGERTEVLGYTPYVGLVRDATIFWRSNMVLTADGAVLNDTAADPAYGRYLAFDEDEAVLGRRDERLLLDVGRHRLADLDAGVMLSGSASQHFGHWVPEYLCKLAYLQQHPRFADLPIIVDSEMPAPHLDYLRLLTPNRIIEMPPHSGLRCRELLTASPGMFFPVHLVRGHPVPEHAQGGFSLAGIHFIRERVLAAVPAPAQGGRKLYLSRRSRGRRPLNDDELGAYLATRGFETVFPEGMSFAEQAAMFRSAQVVVAPNGSALLNLIFSPQDVKILVLSQRSVFNWGIFNGLMRELGYEVAFICGDEENNVKHANYSIPLPRLIGALDAAGV